MLFEMQKDDKLKNNPFAGLATAAAPTMINNMIDGFVTPAAIERGFKQETPSEKDKNVAAQTLNKDFLSEEKGKVETSYKSLNEFQITFIPNEGDPVHFIFERRSLIYWQLAGMKFK